MTLPRVMGWDLAAEQSGVALPDGTTTVIKAKKVSGRKRTFADDMERLDLVDRRSDELIAVHRPTLAVIEDYAAGIRGNPVHRLAECGGAVRLNCWRAGAQVALVNLTHVKIYATGHGGATKSQMATAALSRAGLMFATEDECDAAWMRWLGLDLLGHPEFPLPEKNRSVLGKIKLPDGGSGG
ncbi:crossover junction endodeoxyribonuclease RuvC [Sphaerisporangium viridialbum]|uniref:crossover junction endodeoxyribonuclease RuvC n=1 Tax=Sphaerisporangium viridialbum TaxID=46189 RepID=UPI003C7591A4